MKKFIILIVLLTFSTISYADRTEDLQNENKQLQQEILKRQQEINQITQKIVENFGRLKEIERMKEEKNGES